MLDRRHKYTCFLNGLMRNSLILKKKKKKKIEFSLIELFFLVSLQIVKLYIVFLLNTNFY
jgi:hypothetical protein